MKKTVNRIVRGITCVVVIITISLPLAAFIPHEDPEKSETIYDGLTLFRYYSEVLDSVLAGDPGNVQLKIERIPLANLPENLRTTTEDLVSSILKVSRLIADIDNEIIELNSLLRQNSFAEAASLSITIRQNITSGMTLLQDMNDLILTTGKAFDVSSAPAESTLRIAYDEVTDKITIIRQLLIAYLNMLSSVIDIETGTSLVDDNTEILKSLIPVNVTDIIELTTKLDTDNITALKSLAPTDVTLDIEPKEAFVGDDVLISGTLKSAGEPLGQREVHLFVNNKQYLSIKTADNGQYQTILTIPQIYSSEINVRALYYPQDEDIGVYLSSISPEFFFSVLYYSADLEIQVTPKSYPGIATTINGMFNYGISPSLAHREIEVYLDNKFMIKTEVTDKFAITVNLDAGIAIGKHTVTLSAPGKERYAPVVTNTVLNVTKAIPVLQMNFPILITIPGNIQLTGKLESEIGQLHNADISISLDNSSTTFKSTEEGTFENSMKMKFGFGLVGSQPLVVRITPEEPWHDILTVSRKVLMINIVNCSVFLAVVVFLAVFLSRKLTVRFQLYRRRRLKPVVLPAPEQQSSAIYSEPITTHFPVAVDKEESNPKYRIYSLYISLIRIIQRTTRVLLRSDQTLREFAAATNKALGPVAGYFIDFTRFIEKLLYSQHQPADHEVEQSKQVADKIEQGLKS